MLVLTRKKNESIIIGDNIKVEILDIKGDKVKLGIIAPKDLKILRDELYEEVTKQNKEAVNVDEKNLDKLFTNT